ncbi:response regulator [Petrachloros mirabilis]
MDGYGKRILIIDDDLKDHTHLQDLLEHEGYAVHTACDGIAGADEVRKRHFDAVIANCHMPGLGNAEFYEFFRGSWPDTPVILLSGDADGLTEMGNELERAACISKPYEETLLLDILRTVTQSTTIENTAVSTAS